jgi:hypothetical protein
MLDMAGPLMKVDLYLYAEIRLSLLHYYPSFRAAPTGPRKMTMRGA